jgi:GntR family transcriptional regulator
LGTTTKAAVSKPHSTGTRPDGDAYSPIRLVIVSKPASTGAGPAGTPKSLSGSPEEVRLTTTSGLLYYCVHFGVIAMFIRIQRGSSVPVSRQIDAQIRAQILSKALRPEDPLPSVRQLARELAVNVNTVVRVYERLSAEGLIELRHGDGTYVAQRPSGADSSQLAQRRREFVLELDALVRRGLMLGIPAADLSQRLADSIQRVQQDTPSADSNASFADPHLRTNEASP